MTLSGPTHSAATRNILDDEIRDLLEQVRVLRTKRNTAAAISILPLEMLTRIFMILVSDGEIKSSTAVCLRLTHVCRAWRDSALSYPRLWSRIPSMSKEKTEVWLDRSKDAPLEIHLFASFYAKALYSREDYTSAETVLAHVHQARSLSILASHRFMNMADKYWKRPASLLESLTVGPDEGAFGSRSALKLPDDLFDGNAPRLRVVQLQGCGMDWTSPLLSNLTTLSVADVRRGGHITVSQAFNIICCSPRLRSLKLRDALIADKESSSAQSLSIVHLPSLVSIDLRSEGAACVALLRHLTLPPTVSLRLNYLMSNPGSDFPDLLSMLKAFACDASGESRFRSLILDSRGSYTLSTLSRYSEPPSSPGTFPPSSPDDQTFDLTLPMDGTPCAEQLTRLIQTFRPSGLLELSVLDNFYPPNKFTPQHCKEIDNACPSIQHLGARGQGGPAYVHAVSSKKECTSHDDDLAGPRFAFARLRSVSVENISFLDASLLENLKASFAERQAHGAQIERLTITDCRDVSEDDVWAMEEVVGTLDWDGVRGESDYEMEQECTGESDCECEECDVRDPEDYYGEL